MDRVQAIALILRVSNTIGVGNGAYGREERIRALVPELMRYTEGNLLEIGAGGGSGTVPMLEAAKCSGNKLLVVDAWDCEYTYDQFRNSVDVTDTSLTVCKHRSESVEGRAAIKAMGPYSFAFVDGCQTTEAVLGDVKAVVEAGAQVICVDDYKRAPVAEALANSELFDLVEYEAFCHSDNLERYYVVKA